MALHVLRHVEADQVDARDVGELAGDLGLADAGRAGEQEGADRLGISPRPERAILMAPTERVDRRILTEDHALEIAVQALELAAVVAGDARRRNARDLGDDVLDLAAGDLLALLVLRRHPLGRAGLVDDVDRLVGQMAIVDMYLADSSAAACSAAPTSYLTPWCSSKRDFRPLRISIVCSTVGSTTSTFWKRRESAASFEDAAVLGEGGRADALYLTRSARA